MFQKVEEVLCVQFAGMITKHTRHVGWAIDLYAVVQNSLVNFCQFTVATALSCEIYDNGAATHSFDHLCIDD